MEDRRDFFEIHGHAEDLGDSEKSLFEEIKKTVHHAVTKGGHDYVPDALEYRASSMGVCSRKIQLEKNLSGYLSDAEILQLPMWYRESLSEEKEPEFGAHLPGQVIHEVIQEALQDRIESMEEEVTYTVGRATLKGHYDLLVKYDDGVQVVIDIKSTRSPRRYLPNKKHLRQLMAYQGMMGGIRGALLYVDRNTFEMSYVTQEFDKAAFNRLIKKISLLATYEEQGKLVPPVPEDDSECITTYYQCQFYGYCFPSPKSA
ncbi:MAG: PD-(D/E)XK nuclease family protein [Candidatus Kariarchaeaceae archaeon]|jgi:hypothetical protein